MHRPKDRLFFGERIRPKDDVGGLLNGRTKPRIVAVDMRFYRTRLRQSLRVHTREDVREQSPFESRVIRKGEPVDKRDVMNQFVHANLHDPAFFLVFFHLIFNRAQTIRLFREPDTFRHRVGDTESRFHIGGDFQIVLGPSFRIHL